MKNKILWITRTAVMLALLVVVQYVTSFIPKPVQQYVTGSCVNAVLAVAVLMSGFWSGTAVAVVSPFVAFLFGIGPQLLPIVPAIAAGNLVFVGAMHLIYGSAPKLLRKALAWLGASVAKFAVLYLLVVQLLCNVLPLKQPQIDTFTAMFSLPQLVTALIGGGVAILILPVLKKAVHKV